MKTGLGKTVIISLFLGLIFFTCCGSAAIIHVGPGQTYSNIASGMAAASSGDVVYVHAGTYTLSSTVTLKNGVTLHGDGYNNTIIRSNNKANFASESNPGFLHGSGVSNSEIYGFKFIGPASSVNDIHDEGQTYYGGHDEYHRAVSFKDCSNVKVHDCYATLLLGDFVRTGGTSGIYIYNNIVDTCGHDAGQLYNSRNIWFYNNYVSVMINTGVRISAGSGGNHTIYKNTFTNGLSNSGWCSVQLQGSTTGINVSRNVFTQTTDNYPVAGYDYTGSGSIIRDNIGYSVPDTFCYNLASATKSNNTEYGTEYNWASWGYGYNAASTSGGGSEGTVEEDPVVPETGYNGTPAVTLTAPANGATINPANGKITFLWKSVGSTKYNVLLYANGTLEDSATVGTNTVTGTMNNTTEYNWKVRAYIDSTKSWGPYTENFSFTTGDSVEAKTGVYGIVYTTSEEVPVSGATVTMMNASWSDDFVTGPDGYYEFSVSPETGVYYISAVAEGYRSPEYQLPINSTDYQQRDIALTKADSYFAPHYVKFVATNNYLSERYEDAQISIRYENSDTELYNLTTKSDGSVSAKLAEDISYDIKTTYAGVTQTDTITPTDNVYYIILDNTVPTSTPKQFFQDTNVSINKNEISTTQAQINVTYTDKTINNTTNVVFTLGQYDNNGTFIPQNTSTTYLEENITAGNGSVTHSFLVNDYLGQSYTVLVTTNHKVYGIVERWYSVMYAGSNIPYVDSPIIAYFAVFLLFIVAFQFGRADHATGAIVVCGVFWFMFAIALFQGFGKEVTDVMLAGGSLATIFSIASYINEKRKEDGE